MAHQRRTIEEIVDGAISEMKEGKIETKSSIGLREKLGGAVHKLWWNEKEQPLSEYPADDSIKTMLAIVKAWESQHHYMLHILQRFHADIRHSGRSAMGDEGPFDKMRGWEHLNALFPPEREAAKRDLPFPKLDAFYEIMRMHQVVFDLQEICAEAGAGHAARKIPNQAIEAFSVQLAQAKQEFIQQLTEYQSNADEVLSYYKDKFKTHKVEVEGIKGVLDDADSVREAKLFAQRLVEHLESTPIRLGKASGQSPESGIRR